MRQACGLSTYQKLTCANFLPNAIEFKDPGPNADTAMVKGNKGRTGKTNKLEYTTEYLTPWDPVAKNHNTN